ncbi:hypothetical protein BGX38DRAFT_1146201 [Terfezia claveryi]|nr:hypothetical protein BGX38DRAFT_1146201 [Terfezia claveryi]
MRNQLAGGSESHKKALEALLQDCLKKRSETSKNLAIKRARKRAHAHENSDEEDDISNADEAAGTAVAFWVCDPKIAEHRDINGWIWDERDWRNLVVIQIKTLDGIWDMVKAHVPADRKVREILGARKDPNPPNLSFPADYTSLHSDAEFIPRNEYEDFAEDSDANVRNVAGVHRHRMPTKDHTFEQRKYELRGRVDRQRETLSNIKKEHKCLFPNAGIIDSDDEDYCYIRYLKWPKITSGLQLVKIQSLPSGSRRQALMEEDEEDEDEETGLQPPHLAQSSKRRAASDGARPTRKVRIDYSTPLPPSFTAHPLSSRQRSSPPPLSAGRERLRTESSVSGLSLSNALSDRFSLDSEDQIQLDYRVPKLPRVRPKSRSFFTIPEQYKELTSRAASHVRDYTLFGNPMLNAEEIQQLLSVSWIKAQQETGQVLNRMKLANTHLRSIHSRTRSHLVYECKHSIVELFGLNKLSQGEIAMQVNYLLVQDSFICREDGRETHQRHFRATEIREIIFRKYFVTIKMRGNFDATFFDSINEVFICLVASAMRHCLKAWTTGVYVEPPKTEVFKYDTTVTTYKRFLATWNAHPSNIRTLLLAAIKSDICTHLATLLQKGSLESDQPLKIGDTSTFEAELTQELHEATQAIQLARQRIPDAFQRQSDQGKDQDHFSNENEETNDEEESDNEDDLDEE